MLLTGWVLLDCSHSFAPQTQMIRTPLAEWVGPNDDGNNLPPLDLTGSILHFDGSGLLYSLQAMSQG